MRSSHARIAFLLILQRARTEHVRRDVPIFRRTSTHGEARVERGGTLIRGRQPAMTRRSLRLALSSVMALAVILSGVFPALSFGSPALTCGQTQCPFDLKGRSLELSFGGSRIRCEEVSGRGELNQSAGHAKLKLENCREGITVFGLRCGSGARPRGPALPSVLGAQLMRGTGDVPKLTFLGLRASFNCADIMHFKVEGFLVAHLEQRDCGRHDPSFALAPVLFAHGSIGSQPAYDVYTARDKKTYRIPAPWRMRFGRSATLRC